MEIINTIIDAAEFDRAVHSGLPEGRDMRFIVKEQTMEGRPAVCVTFSVRQTDGTPAHAQAVVPLRLLMASLEILRVKYGRLLD